MCTAFNHKHTLFNQVLDQELAEKSTRIYHLDVVDRLEAISMNTLLEVAVAPKYPVLPSSFSELRRPLQVLFSNPAARCIS